MSTHHRSPSNPSLGMKIDNHAGNVSESPTPRASWRSRSSARTCIPSGQYPHKAPALEPVLTIAPVTRTSSHIEPSSANEGPTTTDAGTPDRESILGARRIGLDQKEERRNIVGSPFHSKLLPKVVGFEQKQLLSDNDAANATCTGSPSMIDTTNPIYGMDFDTANSEAVRVGRPAPAPAKNNTRLHRPDVHGHDHQVRDDHRYRLHDTRPQVRYHLDGDAPFTVQPQTTYSPGLSPGCYGGLHNVVTPVAHHNMYSIHHEIGMNPGTPVPERVLSFTTPLPTRTDSSLGDPSQKSKRSKLRVLNFFKSLYRLPWISSRITADYEPRGRSNGHPPTTQGNLPFSWYARRRRSLDLLSSGESLPTIPLASRRDRTLMHMSSTGSPSPQIVSPDRRHNHSHERNNGHLTPHTPLSSPTFHQNDHGIQLLRDEGLADPTIRRHRHDSSRHGVVPFGTGRTKLPTSRKDGKHKIKAVKKNLDSPSREPRLHKSPTYPAIFYPAPPQPLYIMLPHGTPCIVGDQAEMRPALPLYVLSPAPYSATTVLPSFFDNMTRSREPEGIPGASHPTPVSLSPSFNPTP